MNIKNISLFLGILASIFMFEGRNFEQGPFYVIVWPLVTPDHDQSNCLPVIVKLTLGAFIWVVTHQIPSKTDRSRSNYICPTPNFVQHFESQRPTLIIEYLPCCQWPERPPWFLWCPRCPSIQIKWETAGHFLAWPLAPGVYRVSVIAPCRIFKLSPN